MSPAETEYNVRPSTEADLPPVLALIHETIDTCYSAVYPPRAIGFFKAYHSAENLRKRHLDGNLHVLEYAGYIGATGALVNQEILGVFVHPRSQGRGFGRAIMQHLEQLARTRGLQAVSLSVSLPSRAFYERLGYQILDTHSMDVGEGQHLDHWTASRRLRP